MGFQFVHIESYSRKPSKSGRTVGNVLDEAERRLEASTHVAAPGVPVFVHGCGLDTVRARHDEAVVAGRASMAGGRTRAVRVDQHTMLTVVASHPSAVGEDPAAVLAWQARTVEWMRGTWGDRLLSVIRHDDEAHPHLHAYVLPDAADMKAKALHPGHVAKDEAKAEAIANGATAKVANALGDAAYKVAMRSMQDRYFEQVGVASGLARLGPGRRRLDRGAWQAEQAVVASASVAIAAAETARVEAAEVRGGAEVVRAEADAKAAALAQRGRAYVERARSAAADAVAAADAADRRRAAAERRAAAVVSAAQDQAAGILAGARAELVRLRALGERIGSVVAAALGQSPARVAARLAPIIREEEHAAAVVVVDALRENLVLERQRSRDAEKAAQALRASVVELVELVSERDRAQAEAAALRGRRPDRSAAHSLA